MESVELTKKGKPRKRKPKTKNVYFTLDTQDAILVYRNTENLNERNKIDNSKIHNAFYKLVENIIHTYKFYQTEVDDLEDLKYEVISFLHKKISLYDESKGKAYSYFGTIAKRYLIAYCKKNYSKLIEKKQISTIDTEESTIDKLIVNPQESVPDRVSLIYELVDYIEINAFNLFEREEEIKVADALALILKRHDTIGINNKKALYIYIKEIVDVKSSIITPVIDKIKIEYKRLLNHKIENEDGEYL
jgi:hypothetical protein